MTVRRPEDSIQRTIVKHYRARALGKFMFACPNGGYRRPVEAAILKGLGVVAGVPDLVLIHDGAVFGLELKAPNGRLSPAQIDTQEAMRAAGASVAVAVGLDEALAWLGQWGPAAGARVMTEAPKAPAAACEQAETASGPLGAVLELVAEGQP